MCDFRSRPSPRQYGSTRSPIASRRSGRRRAPKPCATCGMLRAAAMIGAANSPTSCTMTSGCQSSATVWSASSIAGTAISPNERGNRCAGSSCGDRSRASGYRSKYSDIRTRWGRPAATTRIPAASMAACASTPVAHNTSSPRRAKACAIGIRGLTCPSPDVLVTSTLMVRRRRARSRAAGRGTVPARRDAGSGHDRARPRVSIVRCGCATTRDSRDRDRRRATRRYGAVIAPTAASTCTSSSSALLLSTRSQTPSTTSWSSDVPASMRARSLAASGP